MYNVWISVDQYSSDTGPIHVLSKSTIHTIYYGYWAVYNSQEPPFVYCHIG